MRLAGEGMVSVVIVADPRAPPGPDRLRQAFEIFTPFKTHLLIDLERGAYAPSKHHRDRIRRAGRRCAVKIAPLAGHLDDWTSLYDGLIERHAVQGTAVFSAAYFRALAADPRFVTFVVHQGEARAATAPWVVNRRAAAARRT